jgi:hypothetical protein
MRELVQSVDVAIAMRERRDRAISSHRSVQAAQSGGGGLVEQLKLVTGSVSRAGIGYGLLALPILAALLAKMSLIKKRRKTHQLIEIVYK